MIIITILTLIAVKSVPSINLSMNDIHFCRISAIILTYCLGLNLNILYLESLGSGQGVYSGLFQVTQVSVTFELFLLLTGSFILFSWPYIGPFQNNKPINDMIQFHWNIYSKLNSQIKFDLKASDYCIIILFVSLGSSLLISSFDLVSLYISIELQSFGLYVLSTLYKESENSAKAGLKYFLIGGLASSIILLGASLIYSYTGLTNFDAIYSVITTTNNLNNLFIETTNNIGLNLKSILDNLALSSATTSIKGLCLGIILIFIGFSIKLATAPFHNWSPDVYDEVPTIVTTWLTIIPKISILILLLELQLYGLSFININYTSNLWLANLSSNLFELYSTEVWNLNYNLLNIPTLSLSLLKPFLFTLCLFSLIIGTVLGLPQTRIKRLLAYSTISHLGFILLGLGINSVNSIFSFFFYIIQYSITNLNIFLIILAFGYISNPNQPQHIYSMDIRYIYELKGKFFSNPYLSVSLIIALLSLAGIPPLIGFYSKQFVLTASLINDSYFIAILAIFSSVISAYYYLKIIKILLTESTKKEKIFSIPMTPVEKSSGLQQYPSDNSLTTIHINEKILLASTNWLISLSNCHSYLISILTFFLFIFLIKPTTVLNSTQVLSFSLFFT